MYKRAKKWHCKGAIIFYLKEKANSFAVVASKKVGNAVVRNRSKRLIRSVFKDLDLEHGCYVFIVKQELKDLAFLDLEKNLKWGLRKLQCLKTA